MIHTIDLLPGVTLRCFPDDRFKHGCLSVQLVRPMGIEEAAMNALLPAVLLRGCRTCPDLRDITLRLDDLYGASIGAVVRRVGDYQTTGLYASFVEDRFAMGGDRIFEPVVEFLRQLLLEPVLENGAFLEAYVESEKKNLIATIESQRNDKRAYAMEQLVQQMCKGDSFGIPRLGTTESVAAITPGSLYAHYRHILSASRVELFYVGSEAPEAVADMVRLLFDFERSYVPLAAQTGFAGGETGSYEEKMDVNQGKLCMGFVTPITVRSEEFVAMQVLNMIFGGGMTSKLFSHIRERLSLCYAIGSGYHGAKGIMTVSAGIDSGEKERVQAEVLALLEDCREGRISEEELVSAKQALRSGLLSTHDSPSAIENYYSTAALSGLGLTPQTYLDRVDRVTLPEICKAANKVRLHTVFFLKGVEA